MDNKLKVFYFLLFCHQEILADNLLYNEGRDLCDAILKNLEDLSDEGNINKDEITEARIFITRLKTRFQKPQSYLPVKSEFDISHIDETDIIERAVALPDVQTKINKTNIDTLVNDMHRKYFIQS